MAKKQVTSYDVAQNCGVSQMTVSRVFTGRGRVGEETRQRVREAARRLGYQPNFLASGLRGGQTRSVGIVWGFGNSPSDAQVGLDVLGRLQDEGYAIYQAQQPFNTARTCRLLDDAAQRQVDALIYHWESLVDSVQQTQFVERLARFQHCLLVVPEPLPLQAFEFDMVVHNRLSAVCEVVDHFAKTGRRRPVFVAALSHPGNRRKGEAFLKRCRKHGLPADETALINVPSLEGSILHRYTAALEARFRNEVDADAIFCAADDGAMVATRLLKRRGLKVPEDVAVVGFNNSDLCLIWDPPMASVDRRGSDVAGAIESLLLARLEGTTPQSSAPRIDMRFVWRESAG